MGETNHGTVVAFDKDRGLGYIAVGDDRYIFHCVEIVGGSRDIAVNTPVSFEVATRFEIREAAKIKPLSP